MAVIVVVVVVVLAAVALALERTSSPAIQVGELVVWAPDDVCGLSASPNYYYQGFNSSTSTSVTFPLLVPDNNATACTVSAVGTNTSGFTVTALPLPITVGNDSNDTLNITIHTPSSAYSGNLNLIFYGAKPVLPAEVSVRDPALPVANPTVVRAIV